MSDSLSGRCRVLYEIERFIDKAATLIRCSASPLEDIIFAAASDKRLTRLSFLSDISSELDGGCLNIRKAWQDSLKKSPPEYICAEELSILEELGETLGSTDIQGQLDSLSSHKEAIRGLICEAERERREKGRLYRILGVTVGLFAAVILI